MSLNLKSFVSKWYYISNILTQVVQSGFARDRFTICKGTVGRATHCMLFELPVNCSMPNVRILLVNTKVPRSTKKMVAGVRELLTKVTNK